MPKVVVGGDGLNVGVGEFTPNPSLITPSNTNVRIDGNPVVVHGDIIAAHMADGGLTIHSGVTVSETRQSFFKVNGKVVALDACGATCSHTGVSGNGFVNVVIP